MLIYNTMRFGTDTFTVTDGDNPVIGSREALLISADALDASNVSAVDNFIVEGSQPSGTDRRFLFKIDDKVYKFDDSSLVEYTDDVIIDNVLANGNTADEIAALSNITALVGKKIYPIIAIKSTNLDNPTVKLGFKTTNTSVTKSKTVTSAQFTLTSPQGITPKIVDISADTALVGDGAVNVTVRLQAADGTWSSYMTFRQKRRLRFCYRQLNFRQLRCQRRNCHRRTIRHLLNHSKL